MVKTMDFSFAVLLSFLRLDFFALLGMKIHYKYVHLPSKRIMVVR